MTSRMKRVLRQRLWSGDEARPQDVGENLRNAESAILSQLPTREVGVVDQAYPESGIVFAARSVPRGALVMYVERADGTWQSCDAVPQLSFASGVVTAKINGLTAGERYAAIRLLVIG